MSSPRTPRDSHRRHPSNIDLSFATPLSYNDSPRRHSKSSIQSPITPGHRASDSIGIGIGIDVFSSGGGAASGNGLGNLADELEGAWSGDEEEGDYDEPDMNFQEVRAEGEMIRDSGVDITSSPIQPAPKPLNLTPPMATGGRHHKRTPSEYDGSDYGEDSDMDSPGIPSGLQARMDMVEALARRGTENNGTDRDEVVKRVIEGLKDLGGQSGVEGGATR